MHRELASWISHRWAKWLVLVIALLVVGVIGGMFGSKLTEVQKNDVADWLPENSESSQVLQSLSSFGNPNEIQANVLLVNSDGPIGADSCTDIASAVAALKDVNGVTAVASTLVDLDQPAAPGTSQGPAQGSDLRIVPCAPNTGEVLMTSDNGHATQIIVTITMGSEGWNTLPDTIDAITTAAKDNSGGLDVYVGGPAAFGADQANAFGSLDTTLLLTAVVVVVILLLLTYRSPVLWIIPLFAGLASVSTAQGVVYLLAKYADLTVNGQSAGILSVLVLGASIDYALLLVARYREELHTYEDRHEAMAHALHRAAPAILASGATVILGLLVLSLASLGSTAGLGPVGAVGIAAALLMMLVLLPALLVIFGRWVFWPFIPRFDTPEKSQTGLWAHVGKLIATAPRTVWIVTAGILVLFTLGGLQLNATGLSNADQFTTEQPSVTADKKIAEYFSASEGSPLQIVATTDKADDVIAAVEGVSNVYSARAVLDNGKGTTFITAEMSVPADSDAAEHTVIDARDAVHAVEGADAKVGGQTALTLDVNAASAADNMLIIPIVLVVVFLVLAWLLRSIAAPLMLLATVVLSFFAAIGLSAVIFRHVFGFPGADPSLVLYSFVFLVALGIDYNIFLMTRVREETQKVGTRKGTLIALAATGGVITSAGLVLAGTFSALAVLPVVVLAQLGFIVALGVLLDTIVVRSILVTALNLDFGRHIWWPSKLGQTDGSGSAEGESRVTQST